MELQVQNKIDFTEEQLQLIKSQIAPNAKPDELKLFIYQAKRTGLDPMARQIYCIHRAGRMTIQTSIDGFRVIAERSGDYGGQSEPEFVEDNGKLVACKITVYRFRGDVRYPASVGVAYMSEYNAGGPMWQKMPHTMLSKCAEAVALRKAYPQDLSGLYTGDEMQQAEQSAEPATEIEDVPTKEERQLLASLVYASDLNESEQEAAFEAINTCTNYKQFERIQHKLESRKKHIDQIINPSQTDIKEHLKAII